MTANEQNHQASDHPFLSEHGTSFHSFQARLQEGDSVACADLFQRYAKRLSALAQDNLHPVLKGRFDSEDVIQSVFGSFFRRCENKEFTINHSQQLWHLLATLTLCKTRSLARRHTAKRRDVRVEQGGFDEQIFAYQPKREDLIAMWDEIELSLVGLPTQTGEILALRMAGKSRVEIASEMGLSRQSIYRLLKLLEDRLLARFETLRSDVGF